MKSKNRKSIATMLAACMIMMTSQVAMAAQYQSVSKLDAISRTQSQLEFNDWEAQKAAANSVIFAARPAGFSLILTDKSPDSKDLAKVLVESQRLKCGRYGGILDVPEVKAALAVGLHINFLKISNMGFKNHRAISVRFADLQGKQTDDGAVDDCQI